MSQKKSAAKTSKLLTSVFFSFCWLTSASSQADDITIMQKNRQFLLNGDKIKSIIIHVGDTLHFQNDDPFYHNIFSLSDLNTFDLGSIPTGQSRSTTFDKAGTLEVECAIHPEMILEVIVK